MRVPTALSKRLLDLFMIDANTKFVMNQRRFTLIATSSLFIRMVSSHIPVVCEHSVDMKSQSFPHLSMTTVFIFLDPQIDRLSLDSRLYVYLAEIRQLNESPRRGYASLRRVRVLRVVTRLSRKLGLAFLRYAHASTRPH